MIEHPPSVVPTESDRACQCTAAQSMPRIRYSWTLCYHHVATRYRGLQRSATRTCSAVPVALLAVAVLPQSHSLFPAQFVRVTQPMGSLRDTLVNEMPADVAGIRAQRSFTLMFSFTSIAATPPLVACNARVRWIPQNPVTVPAEYPATPSRRPSPPCPAPTMRTMLSLVRARSLANAPAAGERVFSSGALSSALRTSFVQGATGGVRNTRGTHESTNEAGGP